MIMATDMLLETRELRLNLADRTRKSLFGKVSQLEILKGIDFQVRSGESVGVVGESGSGKTSFGRTIMRLYRPTGGIKFRGADITHYSENELRPLRADMHLIFQDPQSSLNPRHTIRTILTQPLWAFEHVTSRRESERIAQVLLERVGLPAAFVNRYPHQLNGGERQRVGIARAVALRPKLIVADEFVSGLDISAKARILELLQGLKRDLNLALIFISHDLAVVRHICDRVLVLHEGQAVETGTSEEVFRAPVSVYTRLLLSAIPLPVVESDWLEDTQPTEHTVEMIDDEESGSDMEDKIEISGCTALVTGANRGIGREFVEALLKRGAKKGYACSRNVENLEELITANSD